MKYWRVSPYGTGETAADALENAEEALAPLPQVHVNASPFPRGRDLAGDPMNAFRSHPPVRLELELDDAVSASVSLEEARMDLLLESTQRVKDYRELERRSVPAVHNFGREQSWSSGSDW